MKIKQVIPIFGLFMASQAFAGARHIYCDGGNFHMDVAAKGPRPIGKEISIRTLSTEVKAKEVFRIDDNDSYGFQIIYQSDSPEINVVAALEQLNDVITLSIAESGQVVGKLDCKLGF